MVKPRKNDAVCAPAPDEKLRKKGKRNVEDDADEAASENVVPVKDDHSKVKKELPPEKEPTKKKGKSRKRERNRASKVEPGSICDEDNESAKQEPAKEKKKSRKRQRSSASKVEPDSRCDDDNGTAQSAKQEPAKEKKKSRKRQRSSASKVEPDSRCDDDNGSAKQEPAKETKKSRKRQRSSASKVEPDSRCDDDNGANNRSCSSAAATLPNSLFVANLSGRVTKKKLEDFFEDVGEIIGIKFDTFDDGSSKGFARVQFATSEAVEKACMYNGHLLMGQPVRLNYGHKRRMVNHDSTIFKKPEDYSKNTVLIKGFDPAYDPALMTILLNIHFEKCECDVGKSITRSSIQKDKVSGASEGVAFMEFSHPDCMPAALSLDGTVLNGFTLQVEEAKHVEGAEHSSILPVTSTTVATTLPATSAEGSTMSATMPPVNYSTPSAGKRIVLRGR